LIKEKFEVQDVFNFLNPFCCPNSPIVPYSEQTDQFLMSTVRGLTPMQNVLCGFAGFAIPRAIFHPLDTMKLISGNNQGKLLPELGRRLSLEGLSLLYHGVVLDSFRVPPQFLLRYLLTSNLRRTSLNLHPLIVDNVAAVVSVAAVHPIEVIHSLMQSDSLRFSSIAATASYVLRTEGIAGFYRGLLPTIIGYVPYRVVQYTSAPVFEMLRRTNVNEAVISTTIAIAAQFATFPFEVIRKRMMSDTTLRGKSLATVVTETWKKSGVAGFYASFSISMLRISLSFGHSRSPQKSLGRSWEPLMT
jgi:hypothetical protein